MPLRPFGAVVLIAPLLAGLAQTIRAADGGSSPSALPRPAYLPQAPASTTRGPAFRLRREPGHGWVLQDARFGARIAEDGMVTFTARHGSIGILLPVPLPLPEGTPSVEGWIRGGRRKARPEPPPALDPVPRMSPYRPDPGDACVYPRSCFFDAHVLLINTGGTFDLSDEILRLGRKDPHRQQKAEFLAWTADLRRQLAQRARGQARTQALAELRGRLDAIAGSGLSVPERRAAMQGLADDLDPDPAVSGPARALIEARIQALNPR